MLKFKTFYWIIGVIYVLIPEKKNQFMLLFSWNILEYVLSFIPWKTNFFPESFLNHTGSDLCFECWLSDDPFLDTRRTSFSKCSLFYSTLYRRGTVAMKISTTNEFSYARLYIIDFWMVNCVETIASRSRDETVGDSRAAYFVRTKVY